MAAGGHIQLFAAGFVQFFRGAMALALILWHFKEQFVFIPHIICIMFVFSSVLFF